METDDHSGTLKDVSDAVFTGELQLWVWKTDDSLILMITSVGSHRDGHKEMTVAMLAGSGLMEIQPEVAEGMRKEAENMGCDSMIAYVKPHLSEKFGAGNSGSFLNMTKSYVVFELGV